MPCCAAIARTSSMLGLPSAAMDLFMLVCFGGQERTVDELTSLATGCGLRLRRSTSVADERTLLEFGL